MKNNKRTWKQFATQLVTLAIVLSLVAGITKPRQAQAVDYGLKNRVKSVTMGKEKICTIWKLLAE